MTGACSFGRAGGALERRSSSDGPPRRQGRRPRRACMGKGVGPPFEPRTAENDARVPSPTVGFPGELFRRARAPRAPPAVSRGKCARDCAPVAGSRAASSRRRQSESPSFSWQGSRVRDRVGSAYSSPQSTAPRVSRRLLLLARASESERNARVERPRVSRARCASIGGAQPRGMHAHTPQ